ncbi:MAG: hypothetical protein SFY32_10745 [Bacteroidota bacterium]|nr:hypothetical protein [Bacteroidota bacterium]
MALNFTAWPLKDWQLRQQWLCGEILEVDFQRVSGCGGTLNNTQMY